MTIPTNRIEKIQLLPFNASVPTFVAHKMVENANKDNVFFSVYSQNALTL